MRDDQKHARAHHTPALEVVALMAAATLLGGAAAVHGVGGSERAITRGREALETAARLLPRSAGMVSGFAAPAPVAERVMPAQQPPVRINGRTRTVWDRPLAEVWPGRNAWSEAEEEGYRRFVAAIGGGFARRVCYRLDDCLTNPAVNPLHTRGDVRLGLHPDCADLAYTLRAYYAFKRDLPFGWVRIMGGDGGDPRYLRYGTPTQWSQWNRFSTPREVFRELPSQVHSGMFRLSPKVESGDTYAARIDRASVRPGTAFYDTDGHVLVVVEVTAAGDVAFIDGHPDGSITYKHIDRTFIAGTSPWGGGFRNWRPQRVEGGRVVRARNESLVDHDPRTQYEPAGYVVAGARVRYDQWVRDRLAAR